MTDEARSLGTSGPSEAPAPEVRRAVSSRAVRPAALDRNVPARCPSCRALGPIAEPCPERVCQLRGYHRVPENMLPPDSTSLDPLVGQLIDELLVVRPLGAGGFGKVYSALQRPALVPVALKLVSLDDASPQLAALKLQKFDIEATALSRISHPNIVRFLGSGNHRGTPYMVMELVQDGCTLGEEIEVRAHQEIPFEVQEVWSILRQVLAALRAAHAEGIIHRDMKPENVMLTPPDATSGGHLGVKVLDFGLAKMVESRTATTILLGTPSYMAPEQLRRERIGPWTDIYAVGVMAFELLTGHRPYPGAGVQETIAMKLDPGYDPWSRVAKLNLPHELRVLVARTLCTETEARVATIDELEPLLERAVTALGQHKAGVELTRLLDQTEVAVSIPVADLPAFDPTRRMPRPAPPPLPGPAEPLVTWERSPPSVDSRAVAAAPRRRRKRWIAWTAAVLLVAGGAAAAIVLTVLGGPTTPGAGAQGDSVPARMLPGFEAGAPVVNATVRPGLVRIPGGRLERGSPPGEPGRSDDEPLHDVRLRNDILVMPTEVTQEDWESLMGTKPWGATACGPTCPVEGVSWWDAVAYADALSLREGRTACYALTGCTGQPGDGRYACADVRFVGVRCDGWRLPTEAEWEFSARVSGARVGTKTGAPVALHAVATAGAGGTALHDLLGNVREWCHDAYAPYRLDAGELSDPTGPALADPTGAPPDGLPVGSDRVVRGGGWRSAPDRLRPAARDHAPPGATAPDLGFRLVRTLP